MRYIVYKVENSYVDKPLNFNLLKSSLTLRNFNPSLLFNLFKIFNYAILKEVRPDVRPKVNKCSLDKSVINKYISNLKRGSFE